MNEFTPTIETGIPPVVPPDVPPVEINLNKDSSTSGGALSGTLEPVSGTDVPANVPPDVPPVENLLNKENSTSGGALGGTSVPDTGPDVGPAGKDARTIFRESKTFKNYFDSNSTDEVMNQFLDENQNFLELPEADEWELFTVWMLNRFIAERKVKKLREIREVLLDIISQGFYTRETKERLKNMSNSEAIDFIIKNMRTDYEVNVLRPKIERYFKYLKELNCRE
jgi:hypothetical protein